MKFVLVLIALRKKTAIFAGTHGKFGYDKQFDMHISIYKVSSFLDEALSIRVLK